MVNYLSHEIKMFPLTTTRSVVTLLWVAVFAILLCGTAIEANAETYLQAAQGLLKNFPADAHVRKDLEAELVSQANAYRKAKGIPPLRASASLQQAARAQAIDMMMNNFVGHRSSSGYEFDSRMRSFISIGNPFSMPQMAENAARDTQGGDADIGKTDRLFQQWVHSAPHRKALINSGYKFVSTGVVQRGNKIWAIQIFFAPLPGDVKMPDSDGLY